MHDVVKQGVRVCGDRPGAGCGCLELDAASRSSSRSPIHPATQPAPPSHIASPPFTHLSVHQAAAAAAAAHALRLRLPLRRHLLVAQVARGQELHLHAQGGVTFMII